MLKFSRRRVNLRTLWHLRKRAWVSLDNHWTRYDSICINDLQKTASYAVFGSHLMESGGEDGIRMSATCLFCPVFMRAPSICSHLCSQVKNKIRRTCLNLGIARRDQECRNEDGRIDAFAQISWLRKVRAGTRRGRPGWAKQSTST